MSARAARARVAGRSPASTVSVAPPRVPTREVYFWSLARCRTRPGSHFSRTSLTPRTAQAAPVPRRPRTPGSTASRSESARAATTTPAPCTRSRRMIATAVIIANRVLQTCAQRPGDDERRGSISALPDSQWQAARAAPSGSLARGQPGLGRLLQRGARCLRGSRLARSSVSRRTA